MEQKYTSMLPYEALRNAVIIQAAKDYGDGVPRLMREERKLAPLKKELEEIQAKVDRQNEKVMSAKAVITEVESFFRSDHYKAICTVDGNWMIEELRKETGYAG